MGRFEDGFHNTLRLDVHVAEMRIAIMKMVNDHFLKSSKSIEQMIDEGLKNFDYQKYIEQMVPRMVESELEKGIGDMIGKTLKTFKWDEELRIEAIRAIRARMLKESSGI